jgi:hypothetical protein
MMLIMVFGGVMMLAMPYITVSHLVNISSSSSSLYLRSGELMQTMIPRHRKIWIPNYYRTRSRTKHGLGMRFRMAI